MISETIESDATPEPETPKARRKAAKNAKTAKKPGATKKAPAKDSNKKAEVIALMKRGKGAMLAEIMKATGWRAHTVRGLGQQRQTGKVANDDQADWTAAYTLFPATWLTFGTRAFTLARSPRAWLPLRSAHRSSGANSTSP
jgi:hypothetical protein